MSDFIQLAQSIDGATERIVEVLQAEFNNTLDAAFSRDADGVCDDGLVLASLGDEEIYRYPIPDRRDKQKMAAQKQLAVAAFVGFVGESQGQATYTATMQERLVDASRPFGAAMVFNHHSQEDVSAGGQSRALTPNELMYKRSVRYLTALEHTIARYCCRHTAIKDTMPRSDLPVSGRVEIDDGKFGLFGVVYYEFDVEQEVLFPTHSNL